jgi:hypothetical protein
MGLATLLVALLGLGGSLRSAPETRPLEPDETVTLRLEETSATLRNEYIGVELPRDPAEARTLENRRTGARLTYQGPGLAIDLQGGRQVRPSDLRFLREAEEATRRKGARRLVREYRAGPRTLRIVVELAPGEWWLKKWLEVPPLPPDAARSTDVPRIERVTLADWAPSGDSGPLGLAGPPGPGTTVRTLGYPSGCGQVVFCGDAFVAIAHPGGESFASDGRIVGAIPVAEETPGREDVATPPLVVGVGEVGRARRAFFEYIDRTRATAACMVILVNDWYWKDKSRPLEALKGLVEVQRATGVPIDSFTLDDGWDFDWDREHGIWGRLHRQRFPGGWDALRRVGREAGIGISLWFGPIGGYAYRPRRVEFARSVGYEIYGDRLCLSGRRYRAHVTESFSKWAGRGMDYIKVDGFWPDCRETDHGHPAGAGAAIAHMDSLAHVFHAWRKSRPDLGIGYTSGSNPSPFWLQHADFVWRGGADDSHAGAGEPFERHNTFLDACLQEHRSTAMPFSAFVTFDIVQGRVVGSGDAVFERGAWWLAARGSLHHDWYVQPSDLSLERWSLLARVARWARGHERLFRWTRMVGGDPRKGEVYGFSSWDAGRGFLALRNPAPDPRSLESPLARLLELSAEDLDGPLRFKPVFGRTDELVSIEDPRARQEIRLPAFGIAVWEVRGGKRPRTGSPAPPSTHSPAVGTETPPSP